jgi:CRP-like cAMP-binding protein
MALSATPTSRNRLLAALPSDVLAELWPQLKSVELPLRHVLQAPGQPIDAVYFPESGWSSMLAYMEDGDAAEVGLIGREGFIGLPVLLGADHDDIEAMVQAPGTEPPRVCRRPYLLRGWGYDEEDVEPVFA